MQLASLKLLRETRRIRIVPLRLGGSEFGGPGVDLLDDSAGALLDQLCGEIDMWLGRLGATAPLRSIVFRFHDRSVVATLRLAPGESRPTVIRLDAHSSHALFNVVEREMEALERETKSALSRRRG